MRQEWLWILSEDELLTQQPKPTPVLVIQGLMFERVLCQNRIWLLHHIPNPLLRMTGKHEKQFWSGWLCLEPAAPWGTNNHVLMALVSWCLPRLFLKDATLLCQTISIVGPFCSLQWYTTGTPSKGSLKRIVVIVTIQALSCKALDLIQSGAQQKAFAQHLRHFCFQGHNFWKLLQSTV